jgi:hypothetical protein
MHIDIDISALNGDLAMNTQELHHNIQNILLKLACLDENCTNSVELGLSEADWTHLDRLAAPHRLRPLLRHHDVAAGEIWPLAAAVRTRWRNASGAATRDKLVQAATLATIARIFAAHGISAMLLKGGAFAWNDWTPLALRPMRDLDLLVDEADAPQAQALLCANGFEAVQSGDAGDKHLPPLVNGNGICVELHRKVMSVDTAQDIERERRLRAHFRSSAYPLVAPPLPGAAINRTAPTETLLHILIHSVGDHQLNNGPLTLLDCTLLITHGDIDWPRFWQVAEDSGTTRFAQFGLALAKYWRPDLPVDWQSFQPTGLPPRLLDHAGDMMLVDPNRLTELGWLGRALRPSMGATIRQIGRALHRHWSGRADERSGNTDHLVVSGLAHQARVMLRSADRHYIANSLRVASWLQAGANRRPGSDRSTSSPLD